MDIFTEKISSTNVRTYLVMSLITVFGVWYIRFLWNRRFLYIYTWNMEGPLSFPFLGCGYLFLGSTHELLKTLIKTQENSKTGIVRLWIGTKLAYLISEPTHIEKILNHPKALNKDDIYKIITSILGEGLLTAPVDTWKRHRKLMAPSFTQTVLSSSVDVFTEHCSIFAKELRAALGKKNVDLYELVIRTTFDIICQTAFGVNLYLQKNPKEYPALFERVLDIASDRILSFWKPYKFLWYFSPDKKIFDDIYMNLYALIQSLMRKKISRYEKELEVKRLDANVEEESIERLPFLNLMLKDPSFTMEEVIAEAKTFCLAGSETNASSTCFLLNLLGLYPEVQMPSSPEEWLLVAEHNEELWNFPNCLGAMDGKHIALQAPINSGSEYYNYKSHFSIVLFALVDANYNFIFADTGCQGRISDGGVFKHSTLHKRLQSNDLNIPTARSLPGRNQVVEYVFLGDEAFPLCKHIMKPFSGTHQKGSMERIFNYRLSRARRIVENVFGISSAVFRILRKPMLLEPEKAELVVMTIVLLHNFLRRNKQSRTLYNPTGTFDADIDGQFVPGNWRETLNEKMSSLIPIRTLPRKSPKEAQDTRKEFAAYFTSNGRICWQDQYA